MTPTIEQQLELEQRMITVGAKAYLDRQRSAEAHDRGDQLDYAKRLMQEFIDPVADGIRVMQAHQGPGFLARAKAVIKPLDADVLAFLVLKNMMNSLSHEEILPVPLAYAVGKMVEDEMRFTQFRNEHEAYYKEIIEDFKRKGTQSYRHKHRVMTFKANEKKQAWEPWDAKLRVDVGLNLINVVLKETDLFVRKDTMVQKRPHTFIVATQETLDWIREHEELKQLMFPIRMPCIIQPADWTDIEQGGYYSPILRQNTQMIKASHGQRTSHPVDYTNLRKSLNRLQHVPWTVNQRVLDVLKIVWERDLQIGVPASQPIVIPPFPVNLPKGEPIPEEHQEAFTEWKRHATRLYTADKERISKAFQVTRVIRTANEYAQYKEFYYVWYADFRGRLYSATAGFSPQGPDFAKGTLQLARGKVLGERGWYWLRVHLANRFGYDKDTYDNRVLWVDAQSDALLACADDPLSHRHLWANADKPYQFLAAVFEYAGAIRSADPCSYVSHLPIGLDGSCNGLQNYSAMLRDSVGGQATNLLPGAKPEDIYGIVARVLLRKLAAVAKKVQAGTADEEAVEFVERWLAFGIDRKLCKRPVMTLPYGATRQSCTEYIWDELVAKNKDLFGDRSFRAAVWLTPLLWSSIGEVVVAARAAMDWLQKCSSIVSKENLPIEWVTADGFRVHQKLLKIQSKQIDSVLAGRFQARVGSFTDKVDPVRQRLGIAPNFVHSMDSTHMRMVINALEAEDIHDFAFIHDDFGTHAADTDIMHRVIREQFLKLYRDNCPLTAFKETVERECGVSLPPLPERGSLDLDMILHSMYFFG